MSADGMGDLFSLEDAPVTGPDSGFFVTNHLNLMYMLAAGLVMPPAGFGDKYYQDTLGCFPGWIPLFLGKSVPRKAIELSTSEENYLRPNVVEVDLSGLSGSVVVVDESGPVDKQFPGQVNGTERVILVPAPLPTSLIKSIIFQSVEDKRACESDARDLDNVPLGDYKRRTSKALFDKAPDIAWPFGDGPGERTASLQGAQAVGGVMAMLLRFANLSEQTVCLCRATFDQDSNEASPANDHPILAGLNTWLREGRASLQVSMDLQADRTSLQLASQARLFWGAIERLVEWRNDGFLGSAEDVLIDHFNATVGDLDPQVRVGVGKLIDTLESLRDLPDASTSELLERHPTPLAHAMTIFFLRGRCLELLDYQSDVLDETDWLVAAILFGVRDGWIGLPLELRAGRELSDAVTHRMAQLSHRVSATGLDFGEPPKRVQPLRELFGDGSAWNSKQKSAALELARAQNWDCIRTLVSLGPGEYRLTVKAGSMHIELPGEPRITPEIDLEQFFESLAAARLDYKTEKKIRLKLGG